MLTPDEAFAAIEREAPRLPIVPVALRDAPGGVLRQSIVAERDQPPFDRVAMDGIALSSRSSAREFSIRGTQAAGTPPLRIDSDRECIEVMTGAMLPNGCDCVVPVERITVDHGIARLSADVELSAWANLHRRASDCRSGDELLTAGTRLRAPEVAIVASSGLAHVRVTRSPRIVVISTGNELIEPGAPIDAWQIRRSNVYAVLAALRAHGFTRVADDHIPDDEDELNKRLAKHLEDADVLILSGGVSMGKFDYVPKILAELNVREVFHRIAQRPGKPMWFGVRSDKAVYALPGNPVSTLACMARYVLPGLKVAVGRDPEIAAVTLGADSGLLPSLATLLPVTLVGTRADPRPTRGSGDFTSLNGSEGCVELPTGSAPLAAGTSVNFYRW